MKRGVWRLAIAAAFACGCHAKHAVAGGTASSIGWTAYAGDAGSLRYSRATDITPDNVAHLQHAWTWRTGETGRRDPGTGNRMAPGWFEATPIMARDTLYLSTPFSRAVALDARTGRQLWAFDPEVTRWGLIGTDPAAFVHRGVALWTSGAERRVFLAARWRLFALDAATGRPIDEFGDGGRVDLATGLRWPVDPLLFGSTSPPAIWGDVVIVGSSVDDRVIHPRDPAGDVQAFDARTGRRLWRWDPVPPAGSSARETWRGNSADSTGHINVWAPISIDSARGLVFLPVSTPSNDWYGGKRTGDNLWAESIVCLEAATGRMKWAHQLVHHGLWDYDLASPPILTTIRRAQDTSDVVVILGKTGFVYAFDRVTGAPRWPLDERPVPASDVPGEIAALTQPVPAWPLPFAHQGFDTSDVVNFTPALHAAGLARLAGVRLGPVFTPPSLAGTVVAPGWIGGAGWGAGAVDPERQLLFVKATNLPALGRLIAVDSIARFRLDTAPHAPTDPLMLRLPPWRTWFGVWHAGVAVPINRPPYGTLTAIDLVTGAQRWQVTLGDTPELREHPVLRGLHLPPLGVAGAPGPVATRSGILFITGGGTTLYAIDARDGTVRWSMPLGQPGYSNPMTYRASDGRQYVVVATGRDLGASLQAFALP